MWESPTWGVLRAGQQAEGPGSERDRPTAADQVTMLYQVHGMDLIRIAAVMLGSRAAAEDAVQDAFYGLYRSWHRGGDLSLGQVHEVAQDQRWHARF